RVVAGEAMLLEAESDPVECRRPSPRRHRGREFDHRTGACPRRPGLVSPDTDMIDSDRAREVLDVAAENVERHVRLIRYEAGDHRDAEITPAVGDRLRQRVRLAAVMVRDRLARRMRDDDGRGGGFERIPADLLAAVTDVDEDAQLVQGSYDL